MKKQELKNFITLVLIVMAAYLLVSNFATLLGILATIFKVIFPFILGIIFAFILNIPMMKIEAFLKKNIESSKFPYRIISLVLSLVILILVLLFVAFMLIPEFASNIELLIQNIPILLNNIEEWVLNLLKEYPDIQTEISTMFEEASISSIIMTLLNYILNSSISFISGIINGVVTIFTALVFAIYMLSQKEYLISSLKKLINAYTKKEHAKKIFALGEISNKTFSKFISGQCVEAIILGLIFFVVLSLFRFPYALLISVLTSITALIPIFGALIAMVIGAILIAITNPLQAVFFIIIFLIIQQFEGNFIYPKVVGASVGLSPILTLLAVTVGGGLFGIIGMLVGLPIASIIYSLIKSDANTRLNRQVKTN